jgi:hypothetical protein
LAMPAQTIGMIAARKMVKIAKVISDAFVAPLRNQCFAVA